ncbi:MAG TPA: hypothetical protein VIX84_06905 [Acidimicrobiales bacterium]
MRQTGRAMGRILTIGCALALPLVGLVQIGGGGAPAGATTVPATVSASNWTAMANSQTTPASDAYPISVSCVTSVFCLAVGANNLFSNPIYYAQQWNGTTWSDVTLPVPAGASNLEVDQVSCVTTTFCVAAGHETISSEASPLILQWNGSAFSVVQGGSAPSSAATLGSVSCTSVSLCFAVGSTGTNASQAFIEQWNGSTWSATVLPAVAGVTNLTPLALSCSSPANCMAVGQYGTPIVSWSLFWNGTTWSAPSTPSPTASGLDSVSCVGTGFCVAVGASSPGSGPAFENVIETWNGTAWTLLPLTPSTPPAFADFLQGVSCFSATTCTAVGGMWTNNAPNISTQVLTWNGQTWSVATSSNVQGAFQTSFLGVDCLADWACVAAGVSQQTSGSHLRSYNAMAPIARSGYRFVASDGGIFNYGAGAPFLGSMGGTKLNAPIVGMATMPGGDGYYLVASDGGIFNFGSAQFYGSAGNIHLNKPVVGMAVTADGGGYWLVASDGGIFSYGDAQFYGSTGAITLNKPIVGMAAIPNGLGYYLVASDGGIFTFPTSGGPPFLGSTGAITLNKPVVGMAVTSAGQYYLVATDGGIFSFPTGPSGPPFLGSTGAIKLNKPVVGMTLSQGGYYLGASDGGIFTFPPGGVPPFLGSRGGQPLNAPIVGISG